MKLLRSIPLVALASVGAFAADPAWYTSVTTELGNIPTMIAGIIVTLVAIALAPIAWAKIKYVLQRG